MNSAGRQKMTCAGKELQEAERQTGSALRKLRETV